MDFYINVSFTVILTLGLVIIYKKREFSENLLFVKLLCYYLLGSFRFNLNKLAVPLGFILYLVLFHPKLNTRTKRCAALFGLLLYIIGVSLPLINKYLYERPKQVTLNSVSINAIDFQKDWKLIKEKLGVNEDTRLEEFNLNYNTDGTIRDLKFELILRKDEGFVYYFIDLLPHKRKYILHSKKIEQWLQYDRLVTAERFFHHISLLNLADTRPSGPYEWYVISSRGELVHYAIKEDNKFLIISKGNLRNIRNEEFPVKGFCISSYGMQKKSESNDFNSYEGGERTDYFFDVTKN
jgi:hypothetical protein